MDGQHETFLLFSLSILKNCRFYLEFQQKKCKCSLYPPKSNEDRTQDARTRSQTSKIKNKSKKSRAAADFGLDILTQMPIKQIK